MPDVRLVAASLWFASALVWSCGSGSSSPGEDGDLPLPSRNFDAGQDGETGTTPITDTGTDTPPCDRTKPFGVPMLITEISTADQDLITDVSPDERTLYLTTNHGDAGTTGVRILTSTRPNKTALWSPPVDLFPNTGWDDWAVSVSPDGLRAVVSSDRSGDSELYLATRNTIMDSFGALTLASGPQSPSAEEGPRWPATGNRFYFDSTRNGSRDIFVSTFDGNGFTGVAPLDGINTGAVEGAPVLSADELTIYFLSDRAPTTDGDIYMATRASTGEPFGNVTVVPNINSSGVDAPSQLSADGCALYLSSTRLGSFDAFVARRPN